MLKNVTDITSQGKETGLNTQSNILSIDKSQSPDMMNVRVHFDGSLEKRFGTNTQNAVIITNSAGAGFSPTGSITTNLIAFWKLDEASGSRADAIGGHVLSDVNSVLQSGGIKNQAANFVAANTQYLIINNTSTLATGDVDFSMSSWIYLNSTSTTLERTIISKRDAGDAIDANTKILIHADSGATITSFVDASSSNHSLLAIGSTQIDTSQFEFGGASATFVSSTTGYLTISESAGLISDFNFVGSDFTVEMFVRPNSAGVMTLYEQISNDNSNNYVQFYLNPVGANLYSHAYAQTAGGAGAWNTGSSLAIVNTAQWTHLAWVKSSNTLLFFVGGSQSGTLTNAGPLADKTYIVRFGTHSNSQGSPVSQYYNGWMDEIRVSSAVRWNSNFTPPAKAYATPTDYEYYLYVNTDQVVTFRVSSSGIFHDAQVRATSFGALGTGTWYNVVAYHDTGNQIAVGVNLSMNSASYASGLRSGSSPFVLGTISNGTAAFFDGRIDETGFWKKVLNTTDRSNLYNAGAANTYQTAFDSKPWASFDFGASAIRWLTVAAGTGVYASSNLGLTWVTVATDRTATYQYFERSKNVLIATSDLYDNPLAWSGSANTFMTIVNSNAPLCKYSINFQGFLILLNSQARKRGFFYQDENTQLTGTWASSFDIPSSQDDEVTASFILRRYLYVSTRYFLYRVSYVGGNPDFSYLKVKDWGYVPRTVKEIYVEGVGQVVKGLCWDGKLRFFDGSDDQISSDNIEQDNGQCDFALDKLSFSGSGPVISFAETDFNENVYKLVVTMGADSTQTTHMLNYDGRAKAYYPYDRQHYNTMVMAESANRRFLMAFDRSGYCHMLDSGNLDGNTTAIDEHLDSNLIFEKSPTQSQKGHQTHMFFSNETSGRLYYQDRTDFDNEYRARETFVISGSDKKSLVHKVIDVSESYNTYQWRLTSSSGTSNPWKLQRYDHFLKGQGIGKQE